MEPGLAFLNVLWSGRIFTWELEGILEVVENEFGEDVEPRVVLQ